MNTRTRPSGNSRMPRFLQAPSTEQEWRNLARRLALVIADLEEDEYLIVTEKKRIVYVQFAAQGFFGMRVEAVSPSFFELDVRFSKKEKKRLLAMGWRNPTYVWEPGMNEPPDGSCNYYMDVVSPSYAALAELAVRTLREVYRTRHPSSLQYKAFGEEGHSIRFPTLGLKRDQG